METKLLTVDPIKDADVVQALGSATRIEILNLLRLKGPLNVNEIATHMACRNRRRQPTSSRSRGPASSRRIR